MAFHEILSWEASLLYTSSVSKKIRSVAVAGVSEKICKPSSVNLNILRRWKVKLIKQLNNVNAIVFSCSAPYRSLVHPLTMPYIAILIMQNEGKTLCDINQKVIARESYGKLSQ